MGFLYIILWIVQALWIILSETINIFRKLQKYNILPLVKFMHIHVAPSSGHFCWTLICLLNFYSKEVSACFLMSGVRINARLKRLIEYENSFESTNTMALKGFLRTVMY